MSIYQEINRYLKDYIYPFHMPGHKRNKKYLQFSNPMINYDITEFGHMDNLHAPQGIIKNTNIRYAKLFNSEESFIMVNGSSGGIIASIMTTSKDGEKILVSRNCHRSVFNGLIYSGATPKYVYPSITSQGLVGGINPNEIKKQLESDSSINTVLITSPTYEGFTSDIEEIAKIVHSYNKVLIVDEAHGAHFSFHKDFPKTAISQGADLVIQSLHKTLPAFTQSAILHVNGERVNRESLMENISMIQTTSPSYILMSGMEICLNFLELNYQEEFEKYIKKLNNFRSIISNTQNIELVKKDIINKNYIKDVDIGKLVFYLNKEINGNKIYEWLYKEYKLQLELSSNSHIVGITSVADTDYGFQQLCKGIANLDKRIGNRKKRETKLISYPKSIVALPPREAINKKKLKVNLLNSKGKISGQFITPYPPGIPILTPGEIITKEIIDVIKSLSIASEILVLK